jgi:saccharopine dehydrogenase-like NADP-dependent oxidoreductase
MARWKGGYIVNALSVILTKSMKELKTSTLVVHGDKHAMAMSRTVGLPAAISAELILDG